jgi:hypothetical protein
VAAVVIAGIAGATYLGWNAVRDARSFVEYHEVVDVLLSFKEDAETYPVDAAGRSVQSFFGTYYDSGGSPIDRGYVLGLAGVVTLGVLLAPTFAAALSDRRTPARALTSGFLTVCLVAPPVLVTQSYFQVDKVGGANARYAIGLLAIPLVASALHATRHRRFHVAGWVAVALLAVATVVGVSTA